MAKQNLLGLWYDPETKKLTLDEEGTEPSFGADLTFDAHPGYNPLQYASEETAKLLAGFLLTKLPFGVSVKPVLGPESHYFKVPRQWLLEIEQFGFSEKLNAGLVANSLIRSNGSVAGVIATLKHAGVLI